MLLGMLTKGSSFFVISLLCFVYIINAKNNVKNTAKNNNLNNTTYVSYEGNNWRTIKSRNAYKDSDITRHHFMIHEELLQMNEINPKQFYVDIGTSTFQTTPSNALDWDRHFSGICVEPNLKYMEEIIRKRTCQGVLNPISSVMNEQVYFKSGDEEESEIINTPNMTKDQMKADNIRLVSTITLNAMLDHFNAPKSIDMLIIHCPMKIQIINELSHSPYHFRTLFIHKPDRELHNMIVNLGFWFLTKYSRNGECLYIHYTIDNFEELMLLRTTKLQINDYFTYWQKSPHLFLLQPNWEKNLKYIKTYKSITTTVTEIDE